MYSRILRKGLDGEYPTIKREEGYFYTTCLREAEEFAKTGKVMEREQAKQPPIETLCEDLLEKYIRNMRKRRDKKAGDL